MSNSKFKFSLLIIIIMAIMLIPFSSYATNENLVVVKQNDEEYIIYISGFLEQEFEFAFSNNSDEEIENLTFISSAVDNPENENNIAYVDDSETIKMFTEKTFMWVKVNGEIKISAQEIEINDNITKAELASIEDVSKKMPIKLEQKQTVNEVNDEGTKITETVGIVTLLNAPIEGEYQLIERTSNDENDTLFALAELIEKNQFTDMYTKVKVSKEFIELCNEQYNSLLSEEWKVIEDSTIYQPNDTKTGDQYILWLRDGNLQDVHFLTSYREYDEEYIKEEVKTKLPYTYDSAATLIALGVVVVAIIGVSVRIVMLNKKEKSEK